MADHATKTAKTARTILFIVTPFTPAVDSQGPHRSANDSVCLVTKHHLETNERHAVERVRL